MAKILLVEDDLVIGESVVDVLDTSNHTVDWVKSGEEGLDRLIHYQYELAILDWNLPKKSGVDVCREYRSSGGLIPIMILTGMSESEQKIAGLDSGADDYVTKPFMPRELEARIRALLRRGQSPLTSNVLIVGDLKYDVATGRVTRDGDEIQLVRRELALLEFLMRAPDHVFSMVDILNRVWSSESDSSELAVRQCVARLRKKIDRDGEESMITNVKGLGYKISPSGS